MDSFGTSLGALGFLGIAGVIPKRDRGLAQSVEIAGESEFVLHIRLQIKAGIIP